jgi:MoaA/NifB/PqqE/SkfB family radical SAM enzyme
MNSLHNLQQKRDQINRVVIVYPFTYNYPYQALPPIAAEYLQAGVHETGREAILLDMRYESDITEYLESADLVCLYGYFEDCVLFGKWQYHVIPEVLKQVPSEIPIIAGGTGFTDPDQTLQEHPQIDIIIRGNPEIPVMGLFNESNPENVNNLVYRNREQVVHTETAVHYLTEEIYPKRQLRNPKYHYHLMGIKIDLIRAAVGCNYRCRFCFQYGKDFNGNFIRWKSRSARSLYNEISEIEAPVIGWVDDDMTTDMKMLEDLADLLNRNKLRKLYLGTGRVDHIIKSDVKALRRLERSGFLGLSFGIESLNDKTLKFYGKGQTMEKVEKGMRMMQKTNILLVCNFIFGSPGETEKDMMDMLWFGRKWNVDSIVTNRFRVEEDSPMWDLIYDPETGNVRPGMERIEGKELARIKYKVKFAQRTPLKVLLLILKLYRHRGMFMDPLYILYSFIETAIQYSWLRKTLIIPALLWLSKFLLSLTLIRWFNKIIAYILTLPVMALNKFFEFIDRYIGYSTAVIPRIFLYLKEGLYKKHSIQLQKR